MDKMCYNIINYRAIYLLGIVGVQCHLARTVCFLMGIVEPAKRGNLSQHRKKVSYPHLLL